MSQNSQSKHSKVSIESLRKLTARRRLVYKNAAFNSERVTDQIIQTSDRAYRTALDGSLRRI